MTNYERIKMKTCKNCLGYQMDFCDNRFEDDEIKEYTDGDIADLCRFFSDYSEWIQLPNKPLPLIRDNDPLACDVYCPYCGKNLSGYYGDEPTQIIQCFGCGNFLDNTRTMT